MISTHQIIKIRNTHITITQSTKNPYHETEKKGIQDTLHRAATHTYEGTRIWLWLPPTVSYRWDMSCKLQEPPFALSRPGSTSLEPHDTLAQVSTRVTQMHASRTQAKRQIPPFSSFPAPGIHRFLTTFFPENAFVGRKQNLRFTRIQRWKKEQFFLTWMDDIDTLI